MFLLTLHDTERDDEVLYTGVHVEQELKKNTVNVWASENKKLKERVGVDVSASRAVDPCLAMVAVTGC